MFDYKNMRKQLIEERRKNAELAQQLSKTRSDIDYLSMMTDIDMEQDSEEEMEHGEFEEV